MWIIFHGSRVAPLCRISINKIKAFQSLPIRPRTLNSTGISRRRDHRRRPPGWIRKPFSRPIVPNQRQRSNHSNQQWRSMKFSMVSGEFTPLTIDRLKSHSRFQASQSHESDISNGDESFQRPSRIESWIRTCSRWKCLAETTIGDSNWSQIGWRTTASTILFRLGQRRAEETVSGFGGNRLSVSFGTFTSVRTTMGFDRHFSARRQRKISFRIRNSKFDEQN